MSCFKLLHFQGSGFWASSLVRPAFLAGTHDMKWPMMGLYKYGFINPNVKCATLPSNHFFCFWKKGVHETSGSLNKCVQLQTFETFLVSCRSVVWVGPWFERQFWLPVCTKRDFEDSRLDHWSFTFCKVDVYNTISENMLPTPAKWVSQSSVDFVHVLLYLTCIYLYNPASN